MGVKRQSAIKRQCLSSQRLGCLHCKASHEGATFMKLKHTVRSNHTPSAHDSSAGLLHCSQIALQPNFEQNHPASSRKSTCNQSSELRQHNIDNKICRKNFASLAALHTRSSFCSYLEVNVGARSNEVGRHLCKGLLLLIHSLLQVHYLSLGSLHSICCSDALLPVLNAKFRHAALP